MISFDSEKCFENFIIEEFNKENICIIDDVEYQECISQFDTKSYGIPDLVFVGYELDMDENGEPIEAARVHVVELKNEQIKLSHISQIARYKTYFERAFEGINVSLQFSLVVPKGIENVDDACWIVNQLDGIDVCEFFLDPSSGIDFKYSNGWHRSSEDFSPALNLIGKE